jgi:hypothetical protein
MTRPTRWSRLCAYTAPVLLLVTPQISFLHYNSYGYFHTESLFFLSFSLIIGVVLGIALDRGGRFIGALLVAILTAFFIDFQFDIQGSGRERDLIISAAVLVTFALALFFARNASVVVTAVVGTILLSSALLPADKGFSSIASASRPQGSLDQAPPFFHILLDGQIGVEGIPTNIQGGPELASSLKSFFLANGFTVFGRAYSKFSQTEYSISHLMNFKEELDADIIHKNKSGGMVNVLKENSYLQKIYDRGYAVNLYQTTYVDLCKIDSMVYSKCITYDVSSIKHIEEAPLSWGDKAGILFEQYYRLSTIWRNWFEKLQITARSRNWELPLMDLGIVGIGPLPSVPTYEQLRKDIEDGAQGGFFFAHLMIPHGAFIYDQECNVKDREHWEPANQIISKTNGPIVNTKESRERRYQLYFQQVECALHKLEVLFGDMKRNGIFEEATILIHGDHGSRIYVREPKKVGLGAISQQDFIDGFSTLFAIRIPGVQPTYVETPVSVDELMRSLAIRDFGALPEISGSEETPWVYVRDVEGEYVRRPFTGLRASGP